MGVLYFALRARLRPTSARELPYSAPRLPEARLKTKESSSTVSRLGAVGVAMLAVTAAGQAGAQWAPLAPHAYIGGNIGRTIPDFEYAPWVPPTGNTISDSDHDTAWKVYGGYQFSRHFAVEGGYFDLGEYDYRYNSTLAPGGRFSGTTSFRGLNLDLVGTFPVSDRLSVLGRVGAIYTRASANTSSTPGVPNFGSRRESEFGGKYGVGLEYSITQRLALRGEVERYHVEDPVRRRGTIDVASVGLVYRFGAPVVPTRVVSPPPPPPARVMPPPPPPVRVMPPPPPPPAVMPPPPPPPPAPVPRPFRN